MTALVQNISVLTTAHPVRHIDPETGATTYPHEMPLFEQLRNEIGASSRRGGQSGTGSRSPIALGAVTLWSEIQESLNTSYISITGKDNPTLSAEEKLSIWVKAAKEADVIRRCTDTTGGWIKAIRELLNPTPSVELVGACPACEQTHAFTIEGEEKVRNTALTATVTEANCRSCGAQWDHTQFEELLHQIG